MQDTGPGLVSYFLGEGKFHAMQGTTRYVPVYFAGRNNFLPVVGTWYILPPKFHCLFSACFVL